MVLYRSADGHLQELFVSSEIDWNWAHANITRNVEMPRFTGFGLHGLSSELDPSKHVAVAGDDGRVYELSSDGGWHAIQWTTTGDPFSDVSDFEALRQGVPQFASVRIERAWKTLPATSNRSRLARRKFGARCGQRLDADEGPNQDCTK